MNAYLDASVLVALFTNDHFSTRADRYLKAVHPTLMVSDFAAAEFASAVARRVRMRKLSLPEATAVLGQLDTWLAGVPQRMETDTTDIAAAARLLRRLDLPLRTADAVNIALAKRADAKLVTFDVKMAQSARTLGVTAKMP